MPRTHKSHFSRKEEEGLRTLLGDPNYREYSETPVGADKPSVAFPSVVRTQEFFNLDVIIAVGG